MPSLGYGEAKINKAMRPSGTHSSDRDEHINKNSTQKTKRITCKMPWKVVEGMTELDEQRGWELSHIQDVVSI